MDSNQYIQDYVEAYRSVKKTWIVDFNKHHGTTSGFCKEHHIKGLKRKRPWYILLKRDAVPLEQNKKRKQLNHTELMEGYVQHKLAKWIKRNPCPVQKDDLFYAEQFPIWDSKRQSAEEYIRDTVITIYANKLTLTARYEEPENKYEESDFATVTDKFGETVKFGGVNNLPKKSKVMRKAQHLTNIAKKKNSKCICTNLKDHKKQRGRILFPEMRIAA
jgi:hypothetical protein